MATGKLYAVLALPLSALFYSGCSSAPPPDPNTLQAKFQKLAVGMNQEKALEITGKPDSNTTENIEVVYYFKTRNKTYYMKILHSEVIEYGVESTYDY